MDAGSKGTAEALLAWDPISLASRLGVPFLSILHTITPASSVHSFNRQSAEFRGQYQGMLGWIAVRTLRQGFRRIHGL